MVLDMQGDGIRLTSSGSGVRFDIERVGKAASVGWTSLGSDDSFLALDLNGNGTINDSGELVGTRLRFEDGTQPTSGADALLTPLQGLRRGPDGRLPDPLPEGAGVIDSADGVFARLLVWCDKNHDGASQRTELMSLPAAGITSIRNGYQRTSVVDEGGNKSRFRGSFTLRVRGVEFQRQIIETELAR